MDTQEPSLHFEVDGSGPALALVNGAWCNVRQWDGVVGRLAEHFTVVRHDVRGIGKSEAGPPEHNTFERYADDLAGLMAGLGHDRFHLWGMAWGARVALMSAARYPERVERLVLSDLGITRADVDAQKAGRAAAKEARAAAGIAEVAAPAGLGEHDDRDAAMAAFNATRIHADLMPFVERIEAPTLIATGEFDPNLESSRRALTGLRDGRLDVLPLTEHGSVLHRADVVLETVLPFLRG
ncbi:MAG: alpha/beta hydrolase [Actinomycetota bacterium]